MPWERELYLPGGEITYAIPFRFNSRNNALNLRVSGVKTAFIFDTGHNLSREKKMLSPLNLTFMVRALKRISGKPYQANLERLFDSRIHWNRLVGKYSIAELAVSSQIERFPSMSRFFFLRAPESTKTFRTCRNEIFVAARKLS